MAQVIGQIDDLGLRDSFRNARRDDRINATVGTIVDVSNYDFARQVNNLFGTSGASVNVTIGTGHTGRITQNVATWSRDESYTYTYEVLAGDTTNYIKDTDIGKLRKKDILVACENLKPYSSLYGFYDLSSIKADITQCLEVKIGYASGLFLGVKNSSVSTNYIAERSSANNTIFDLGEVVQFSGGGTAVVVAHKLRINTQNSFEEVLIVVNQKGAISGTVKGTTSLQTATVVTTNQPTDMKTDSLGNIYLVFHPRSGIYDTGNHEILLMDNESGEYDFSLSKAKNNFYSKGIQHNYERILTYRSETGTGTRTITGTTTSYTVEDPLAQTFFLPTTYENGAFVHSIDLFFYWKDANEQMPVHVEITEVEGGVPSRQVVGTTTILASNVKSTNMLTSAEVNATPNRSGLVPTRAEFFRMLYLKPQQEYAIKIKSNSNKYKVWVSKMGEAMVGSRKLVDIQPNLGSLFMSQNNSTWSPDQMRDLTFVLYAAKFDIGKTGTVKLQPTPLMSVLPPNPFNVTSGSRKVRVNHPNNGYVVGNEVKFYDSSDIRFNDTFTVESVLGNDSYVISLETPQGTSEVVGGGYSYCIKQNRYEMIQLGATEFTPPGTSLSASIRKTDENMELEPFFEPVRTQGLNKFDTPFYVLSPENRDKHLSGANSTFVRYELSSTNSQLSPMINISGVVATCLTNKCKEVSTQEADLEIDLISIVTSQTDISFLGYKISYVTSDFNNFSIGHTILISGSVMNNVTCKIVDMDNVNKTVTTDVTFITEVAGAAVTIKTYPSIKEPFTPLGSSDEASHITMPVSLSKAATGLSMVFDAIVPVGSNIRVFYRTVVETSFQTLKDRLWVEADTSGIINNDGIMMERTINVEDIEDFTAFQFKIVMISTNSAKVPVIKNFRAVALA